MFRFAYLRRIIFFTDANLTDGSAALTASRRQKYNPLAQSAAFQSTSFSPAGSVSFTNVATT